MKVIRRLLITSFLISLVDCAGNSEAQIARQNTPLVMEEFFSGNLTAHGIVKDWRGRVIRRFSADIVAYWDRGVGTIEEDFVFDDGEIDRRVWKLQSTGTEKYNGTAGDVIGIAEVSVEDDSAFLDYILRIPYGDDTLDVRIDDRMYLVSPTVLLNESKLRKFGVQIGELVLVIQK
jgi:hypothetical protein